MQDRRLIGLVGAILLLLALAVLSAPYRSIQGPEIKSHQRTIEANHAQQGAESKPSEALASTVGAPSVPTTTGNGEGDTEAKQGREHSAKSEDGVFGTPFSAEYIIAIFTILLFAATFALYLATRDLVKGAEKTAERQLRAYVSITQLDMRIRDESPVVSIHCVVKNSGQTPAYNLTSWALLKVASAGNAQYEEIKDGEAKSIVGPGGEIHLSRQIVLSDDEVRGLLQGEKIVCISGRVRYADIFDRDRVFEFWAHSESQWQTFRDANLELFHVYRMLPDPRGYNAN